MGPFKSANTSIANFLILNVCKIGKKKKKMKSIATATYVEWTEPVESHVPFALHTV